MRVAIVGAGVTGLSAAYHLSARPGVRAKVFDKGPVGDGSSSRAAGICTGLLWTEAGVRVRQRCLQLYGELSRDLAGYQFRRTGCLNLFSSASWAERQPLLLLYDRLRVPYEVLDADALRRRWPAITATSDLVGLYDPLGGYSEPEEYLPALAAAVRSRGATIAENCPVTGFVTRNGAVRGVRTPAGEFEADAVVCTVYAWTRALLAQLGIETAVKAFVHQRYLSAPAAPLGEFPAVNANPFGIYFRPALDGRLLVGIETPLREEFRVPGLDFHQRDLAVPDGVRETAAARLESLLPAGRGMEIVRESIGLLTFSLDGEPLLGPAAAIPGLYLGLAFHSGGFAYNPGAGELLAQFVADGATAIDVSAWSPDRFDPAETRSFLDTTLRQEESFRRRH